MSVKNFTQNIEYTKNMTFPSILKELRMEKGISQKKLATDIGVSIGLICYWETGQSEPTLSNIIKLAKYFGVTSDYLLGLEL